MTLRRRHVPRLEHLEARVLPSSILPFFVLAPSADCLVRYQDTQIHVGAIDSAAAVQADVPSSSSLVISRQGDALCNAVDCVFAEYSSELRKPIAFISYRREGGAELARVIKLGLLMRDIDSFLDVDDLGPSRFGPQLLEKIAEAPNFVVVLTPGCLDRCVNSDDWMRTEIAYALQLQRNVIPVMKRGFEFPPSTSLPVEIATLPEFSGVEYSHQHFDGSITQLIKFLVS